MSRRERAGPAAEVAAEAIRHLEWLRENGISELARPVPGAGNPPAGRAVSGTPARPAGSRPAAERASAGRYGTADRGCGSEELLRVRAELGECARCPLSRGRTTLVFGVGNPRAELLFVGEGPGADEDREGEPFVGLAGQLLTKMIEAMGLERRQVYIANVVKCRPPGNRNPETDEMEACLPFLRAQIEAVDPRFIVTLGAVAARGLLGDPTPISRLRGRWQTLGRARVMPTFHPAYLLRNPAEKKKAWADLQLVMKAMNEAVSPGR